MLSLLNYRLNSRSADCRESLLRTSTGTWQAVQPRQNRFMVLSTPFGNPPPDGMKSMLPLGGRTKPRTIRSVMGGKISNQKSGDWGAKHLITQIVLLISEMIGSTLRFFRYLSLNRHLDRSGVLIRQQRDPTAILPGITTPHENRAALCPSSLPAQAEIQEIRRDAKGRVFRPTALSADHGIIRKDMRSGSRNRQELWEGEAYTVVKQYLQMIFYFVNSNILVTSRSNLQQADLSC